MMMQVKFCDVSETIQLSDGSTSTVAADLIGSSRDFTAEQTCNRTVPPVMPLHFANR